MLSLSPTKFSMVMEEDRTISAPRKHVRIWHTVSPLEDAENLGRNATTKFYPQNRLSKSAEI